MNKNQEIFEIWAPNISPWSVWVKPILFTNLIREEEPLSFKTPTWLSSFDSSMMIIVDVEGDGGIKEALGLALLGYRPVPLYNGALNLDFSAKGAKIMYGMAVDTTAISKALYNGSRELLTLQLPQNAPPVFILDSARLPKMLKLGESYDNRWTVFPQDFPSADFLKKQGITKVLLRSDRMNDDLLHILYRYKEKGLAILNCNNGSAVKEYLMPIPWRFRKIAYRAGMVASLASNATGGFGKKVVVADPSSYAGGYHYRGG